ncbi:hypothetical protein C8N26_1991 [Tenacibaculum lutimaris]|uniref:Uncharacterized protein n=1 Tax=Tenacibaculum lutimaris TaxID=285258 RepID=A0A420E0G5_9FLAO|nr:hypothetical protein [Tenacibaculum lutimaris]RKF03601.1 hypothetical protein C8N26_1991 [Tenacibaculum lutimaris]
MKKGLAFSFFLWVCIIHTVIGNATTAIVKNNETEKHYFLDSLFANKTDSFFYAKLDEVKSLEESYIFSWSNIKTWYPTSSLVVNDRDKALASFEQIEKHESWVDSFSNEDIKELPVGVKHTRENIQYAIGITQANIYKDYTELTVFARVRLPQTNENGYPIELFFGANNVKLSHAGGIVGDANLVLLGDMHIPFNGGKWMLTLKGGFDYRTGVTQNKTFVTINCDGVKELGIEGEVEFSRELILPLEKNGEVNEGKTKVPYKVETENGTQTLQVPYRVKGAFKAIASDWNDLLVGISLQPFVLAKKRNKKDYDGNFQFYLNEAVLDFSDLRNSPNVKFPEHYHKNGLLLPNQNIWRGVYVNTLDVKLPKEFKTSETISKGSKRVTFGAHHLIIDGNGVSGSFYAENIFPLNKGRTNKNKAWAYSLDKIEVSLATNKLIGASFEGRIQLPVSRVEKKDTIQQGLRYTGIISEEEYLLNVRNDSVVDFNLWKAKGELLPNSAIELKVKEGEFRPKAILHGRLAISANQVNSLEKEGDTLVDSSGKKRLVEFKGIVFQNLVLQTESPIFSVDYMGYRDKVALAGFPVSIENIGITANKTNANLYFDLGINLMGESNGFAAKTSLGIIGGVEEENYKQKWEFQGVDLDAIALKADLGGFSIEGNLTLMNDDPEYGDGFSAKLTADFKTLGLKAGAKGVFGKKTFRYWQFEAMVEGLSIGTGVFNLSGFAGGASYRMKRTDFSSDFSPTGIGYTPDAKLGLGLKAMVMFNAIKDDVFEGRAGFEMVFNRVGGLDFLGFYGQGTFMNVKIPGMNSISELMGTLKKNTIARGKFLGVTKENIESSWTGRNLLNKASSDFPQIPTDKMTISAKVGITYDFQNDVLHGELDAYVNVAGGFVEGRGPGGRAGWAVLHFSPEDWYIYIGTPEDRLGLRIGVGPVSVESGGYFMVGSKLPGSPPPPPIVAEILGVDANELDYMRDENALSNGGGFAFGADISIDTGDLRFLIFYARFQAGAGFDIMLKDYGEARCSNTGDQVGINGWYANGQAYVYLQGELGIHVKLFFVSKKIPIIKAGAAVLLQAKAPNPVWMRGYVGGHFSVLGGLVKGRFRFKLTLGEECVFEDASPLGGLKIITDVTPDDGGKDVDVFTISQATFSMKVGEPIVIPEDEGDKTYKIILEKYRILHKGKEIDGNIEWSNYNDRANFVSTDILPPNEELTVEVEVSFKEKVKGVFQTIMIDGKKAIEKEERTFVTGGAPTVIPLHNITYAYPVLDQKYFFEKEYDKGYIQLKRGQDYLFDDTQWKSYITYEKEGELPVKNEFNYNTSDNIITYNLPNVVQSSKYHLSIVSELKGNVSSTNISSKESNTSENESSYNNNVESTEVEVRESKAENISKDGEIERLAYDFSTSKYKTFKDKINSINTKEYNWGKLYSDVIYLSNRIESHEPFDIVELLGTSYTDNVPLVTIEATLQDDYFEKDINPPLYAKYPLGGYRVKRRDESELGAPPKYALPLLNTYVNNVEYEVNKNMLETTFPFRYNLGYVYKQDWIDIESQIVNDYSDGIINNGNLVLEFLDKNYLFMRYGEYKVKLFYTLPSGIKGTNTTYKFKNPNKFR